MAVRRGCNLWRARRPAVGGFQTTPGPQEHSPRKRQPMAAGASDESVDFGVGSDGRVLVGDHTGGTQPSGGQSGDGPLLAPEELARSEARLGHPLQVKPGRKDHGRRVSPSPWESAGNSPNRCPLSGWAAWRRWKRRLPLPKPSQPPQSESVRRPWILFCGRQSFGQAQPVRHVRSSEGSEWVAGTGQGSEFSRLPGNNWVC